MKFYKKTQTFKNKDGQEVNFEKVIMVMDNGFEIAIKPLYPYNKENIQSKYEYYKWNEFKNSLTGKNKESDQTAKDYLKDFEELNVK